MARTDPDQHLPGRLAMVSRPQPGRCRRTLAATDAASPEPALLAKAMVQHALERLAPRRRAILVLYELDGVAIKDIATMLGISAVTVRWHLSVGRRKWRRRSAQEAQHERLARAVREHDPAVDTIDAARAARKAKFESSTGCSKSVSA